jgi:hypothetical protein
VIAGCDLFISVSRNLRPSAKNPEVSTSSITEWRREVNTSAQVSRQGEELRTGQEVQDAVTSRALKRRIAFCIFGTSSDELGTTIQAQILVVFMVPPNRSAASGSGVRQCSNLERKRDQGRTHLITDPWG